MKRRLAAILAADVVGYSSLMSEDEAGTLVALNAHRQKLFEPEVARHGGRIVKLMGDGALVEFSSVVNAVECALTIQEALAESGGSIRLRIGINLGDVIIEGDDIYGDGVNVAARLEPLAEPSGICISSSVRESLSNPLKSKFADAGMQSIKGMPQPIRIWRWSTSDVPRNATAPLALPDKPSIAVLPFDNMSGDPDQEYLADGITDDVIAALSRFRALFVIARNSSFTYKGKAVEITQVARELGVRYVVEGSVRKAGNRVRVTAQLIDAVNGAHLWADRNDGSLDDVFDLQDRITERIVISIEPEIQTRERERARRKPPDNLDAWEQLQRGLSHYYRFNEMSHSEAIRLFEQAIVSDPEFALAHAHLGYALWTSVLYGYAEDTTEAIALARAAAHRAVSFDPNEPMARFVLGRLNITTGEAEAAIGEMQAAIAINPNFFLGHYGLGHAYCTGAGQAERALPHFDAALRLSPRDPLRRLPLMLKGAALRQLGRHDEAITFCRQACQIPDAGFLPHMHLAASLAEAGRRREAEAEVKKAKSLQPTISLSFIRSNFVGSHETYLNSLCDSLRKAGLLE